MQHANVKQEARQLLDNLPEDVTWEKLSYAMEVRASIERGLADVEAGRVIDGDVMMEWIDSWGTPDEKEPPQI